MTLKTNLIAKALILGVGTPAAYFLATRRFRGRVAVVTLIELPLVLPPAVAGIGLLAAFGRFGLLGEQLDSLGITVGFTQVAVIMAIMFVAEPVLHPPGDRGLRGGRPEPARRLAHAWRRARTGRSARRAPARRGGTGAGAALAFARGLGEFGATIMFAGSLQGVTQTVSLAIYQEFDVNLDTALAISALLVVVSGTLLLAVKLLPLWTRLRSHRRSPSYVPRRPRARGRPRDGRARGPVWCGQDDGAARGRGPRATRAGPDRAR